MSVRQFSRVLAVCASVAFTGHVLAQTAGQKTHQSQGMRAPAQPRTLDGSNNNPNNADLGQAGALYKRVAPHRYADDVAQMVELPNSRYISNRIFNDQAQNFFSENGVTQWAAAWGQFVDHTIGLRDQGEGEKAPIRFDVFDPLEEYQNDIGAISFTRTRAAPDSGSASPREQLNVVSSYLDAWAVYGGTQERLEWLREGPVDGDMSNNSASLLMTENNYLPRATARDAATAPTMELVGGLRFAPDSRVITGDIRANENIALTAIQTLFAREHNRIVQSLPEELENEDKFQIARRVVGALQQWITYREFLPAMGIDLKRYRGYKARVDPTLSNEFATVGYRAHSMVHGEIEIEAHVGNYSDAELDNFRSQGIEVELADDGVEIAVPLNIAFANPDLVESIGLGRLLAGLAGESQYKNDEQIDNQLRSVMFQFPRPEMERPQDCLDGDFLPDCYTSVLDLGAIDIERGRDHGIASYNALRRAYGLRAARSFMELTGESSEELSEQFAVGNVEPIDNPDILLFDNLSDIDGENIDLESEEAETSAVSGVRRTTLAARLKAIYGDIEQVDAFVGMVSEPHVAGTEFGALQLRMWKRQFEALRDGDRYFYRNDPELTRIHRTYGVSYRRSIASVVAANTELAPSQMPLNLFTGDKQIATPHEPAGDRDRAGAQRAGRDAPAGGRRGNSPRGGSKSH